MAEHKAPLRSELHVVPIGGGPSLRLDRPLPNFWMRRGTYAFTSDSRRVVFIDFVTAHDLYAASVFDGATVKLSPSPGAITTPYQLSPDGQRAVYFHGLGNLARVFSARLDGATEPREIERWSGFAFRELKITPDSTRILHSGLSASNLVSTPITGRGAPVQLNGPLPPGGTVLDWIIAPDGKRVVYAANEEDREIQQLFVAPIDGSSAPVRLTDVVRTEQFVFPLGGSRSHILFLTNPTSSGFTGYELHSAPLDGGAVPQALSAPDEDLSFDTMYVLRFASDGERVVFAAKDPSGRVLLRAASVDASTVTATLASLAPGASIRVPVDGGIDGGRADLDLEPVRGRAVFVEAGPKSARLFSVPIDGGSPPVELSGTGARDSAGVSLFVTASRKGRVYYTSDELEPGVFELFSAPVDGSRPAVQLVDF